jgi:hypothetical protein
MSPSGPIRPPAQLPDDCRVDQHCTSAATLLNDLLKAKWLMGDRSYDADWFREALQAKGI